MPIELVKAFRTSDGRLFASRDEAIGHELATALPKRFAHPAPGTVEFVSTNWRGLTKFLQEVISELDPIPDQGGE